MSRFVYEICFACMWMPWFNHPKDKEFSYLLQELKLLQNQSMTQTEEIDSVMT